MNDRLGFLSASGAVVAAVVLAGVLAWSVVAGPVLFSAGPLNAVAKNRSYGGVSSHAQLTSSCGACHTAPWSAQTMVDRCLECHTEVSAQIGTRTGLHGRMMASLVSPTCRGCHTEHHGPSGALTVRDPATFPHDLTAFSLSGHMRSGRGPARMTCEDCHPKDLTQFDQATCATCHTALDSAFVSRHEASFGPKCLLCHNGKTRDASGFDHNTLPFKLTGKHVGLACDRCHPIGSFTSAASTPRTCYACHSKDDRHNGTFGQQCDQCHTTSGWQGARFDHSIFPVDHGSRGQQSNCQTCHPNGVTTYTCYGCHEHTVAGIQAQHRNLSSAQLTNCIGCHRGGQSEGGG